MYADKRENERRLGDAKETVTSQRMELNKMAAMLESASERCATFQKLVESQNAASTKLASVQQRRGLTEVENLIQRI